RVTPPFDLLSSPRRRLKAICAPIPLGLFVGFPRPQARSADAAKVEFSSKDRSENREAGHGRCATDITGRTYVLRAPAKPRVRGRRLSWKQGRRSLALASCKNLV